MVASKVVLKGCVILEGDVFAERCVVNCKYEVRLRGGGELGTFKNSGF